MFNKQTIGYLLCSTVNATTVLLASTLTEGGTEGSVYVDPGGDGLVQKTSGTLHLVVAQPGELVGDKLLLS